MDVRQSLLNRLGKIGLPMKQRSMRGQLVNRSFSVLSMNCMAGTLYHDLGLKFLTPTVNLYFDFDAFIRFLERPRWYCNQELSFSRGEPYPIGQIDDVPIHFIHYGSESEARTKWRERSTRINWDNLFIMAVDRDGFRGGVDVERFERLPYDRKVLFTAREWGSPSCVALPEFKSEKSVGVVTGFADIRGSRYYEKHFDVVRWLNGEETPWNSYS